MTLNNEREVTNTLAKLARLEARYEALRNDTSGDQHVRELTMRSLKGTINQFKEEIARYEAGATNGGGRCRELCNETELANSREKLRLLEDRYEKVRSTIDVEKEVSKAELVSLKRLINQLKEEIARYEAHHAARR